MFFPPAGTASGLHQRSPSAHSSPRVGGSPRGSASSGGGSPRDASMQGRSHPRSSSFSSSPMAQQPTMQMRTPANSGGMKSNGFRAGSDSKYKKGKKIGGFKIGMNEALMICGGLCCAITCTFAIVFGVAYPYFNAEADTIAERVSDSRHDATVNEGVLAEQLMMQLHHDESVASEFHLLRSMAFKEMRGLADEIALELPQLSKSKIDVTIKPIINVMLQPLTDLETKLRVYGEASRRQEVTLKKDMIARAKREDKNKDGLSREERRGKDRMLYRVLLKELRKAHDAITGMKRYWVNLTPEIMREVGNMVWDAKDEGGQKFDPSAKLNMHIREDMVKKIHDIEKKAGRRLAYGIDSKRKNNGLALVPLLDSLGGGPAVGFWIHAVQHLAVADKIELQVTNQIADLELWRRAVAEQDPSIINKKLAKDKDHRKRWKGSPVKVQAAIWDFEQWAEPLPGMESFGDAYTWFSDFTSHPFFESTWLPGTKGKEGAFVPKVGRKER